MSFNFSLEKLKSLAAGVIASGKKNAPSLMTGGSVVLGWVAVYIFWKRGKMAEKKIAYEEEKLNTDPKLGPQHNLPDEERKKLPVKDKFVIYLQYCWMAGVLGVASSALAIGANSISLSRLAEMALLTQFMGERNEKQNELIEKLKGEVDEKKVMSIQEELRSKRINEEDIVKELTENAGSHPGQTLFIDDTTNAHFWGNIVDVTNGITEFNAQLRTRRQEKIIKEMNGPFYVQGDLPFRDGSEELEDLYSAIDLEEFLLNIGEIHERGDCRLGELLEFRCHDESTTLRPTEILKYQQYVDPKTGIPAVCYIDYADYTYPTSELYERAML